MKRRKPKAHRREALVQVRVTVEQKERLTAAAQEAGLDLSSWLRVIAFREAGLIGGQPKQTDTR
jgi:uncharacterized protein (DUF1778 family)